jgi:hypothetical protein
LLAPEEVVVAKEPVAAEAKSEEGVGIDVKVDVEAPANESNDE